MPSARKMIKKLLGTRSNPAAAKVACVRSNINLEPLPDELLHYILSFLCAGNLIQLKCVSKLWKQQCTAVIKFKIPPGEKKVFQTNHELSREVTKYCSKKFEDVERYATTYG